MTPETQGFQLLWGLWWGLAERERDPHTLEGSLHGRGAPRSPRGAAPHCTVTACLVLARQVNSIPPLLSPFFFFSFPSFSAPPLPSNFSPCSSSSSSSVSIFPSTIFLPRTHTPCIPCSLFRPRGLSIATAATSFSDLESVADRFFMVYIVVNVWRNTVSPRWRVSKNFRATGSCLGRGGEDWSCWEGRQGLGK